MQARTGNKPSMTVATCRSWESHRHRDSCHSCQADWERRVHLAQVGQPPRTLSKRAALNTSFVLNSLCFLPESYVGASCRLQHPATLRLGQQISIRGAELCQHQLRESRPMPLKAPRVSPKLSSFQMTPSSVIHPAFIQGGPSSSAPCECIQWTCSVFCY